MTNSSYRSKSELKLLDSHLVSDLDSCISTYELSTQLDIFSPLARILTEVESLFSFVFPVCVGLEVKTTSQPMCNFWDARVNLIALFAHLEKFKGPIRLQG